MGKGNDGAIHTTDIGNEQFPSALHDHGFEVVAEKYLGTTADKQDMMMLGRSQVLRVRRTSATRTGMPANSIAQRNFSFIPILGFGAVLICTWEILFA